MKDDPKQPGQLRSINQKINSERIKNEKNAMKSNSYPLKQSQIFPLKKCPFCDKTPHISMEITSQTWLPRIECQEIGCVIKPKGPYFAIRKNQKFDLTIIRRKICNAINAWNDNCPMPATEGRMIDWDELLEQSYKCHNKQRPLDC